MAALDVLRPTEYPKTPAVLLWIGTAIALSVAVAWTIVENHNHMEYIQVREVDQLISMQKDTQKQVRDIAAQITEQTIEIKDIKRQLRWQAPPVR